MSGATDSLCLISFSPSTAAGRWSVVVYVGPTVIGPRLAWFYKPPFSDKLLSLLESSQMRQTPSVHEMIRNNVEDKESEDPTRV